METTRRSLLNATRDLEGSIEDTMKTYSLKPILNDGANLYGNTRISPKISGPYQDSKEIEISMCSDNFDVTEFENSYMHLDITLTVRLPYYPQGLDLTDAVTAALLRNQYVFVGLKCGSHVIRNYQFKFHDMPLSSTVQSSAVYESFLYSNFKAKGEIANKKFVFSPYDEVSTHDNSICGIYVSLYDIVQAAGDSERQGAPSL